MALPPAEPDVTDFSIVLQSCWQSMDEGAHDRRHGFHHVVLANIAASGRPRSRVMILRSADAASRTLRFHTDVRAAKWQELRDNPFVSVTLYDANGRVQIKIDGRVSLHTEDALAIAAWGASQRMSRVCYGTMPAPGSVAETGADFTLPVEDAEILAHRSNFGVVVVHVETLEWLFLRSGGHRRAVFDLVKDTANWLVP